MAFSIPFCIMVTAGRDVRAEGFERMGCFATRAQAFCTRRANYHAVRSAARCRLSMDMVYAPSQSERMASLM